MQLHAQRPLARGVVLRGHIDDVVEVGTSCRFPAQGELALFLEDVLTPLLQPRPGFVEGHAAGDDSVGLNSRGRSIIGEEELREGLIDRRW